MKDIHYILIFSAAGLALAYGISTPLRRPPEMAPRVGTPLRQDALSEPVGDVKVYVEGTVSLGKGVTAQEAAQRSLFLIVRPVTAGKPAGGPPLAVKKVDAAQFPVSFSLTNENNMVGTDFYDGDIVLVARLDADGMAGPKQAEDVEVVVPVDKTSRKVAATLTR